MRGDVWRFSLDPTVGSEQSKTRPCVIVQRTSANETSPTTIVCPLSDARGSSGNLLHVLVKPPEGGITKASLVLVNQVRTVDRLRARGSPLGHLNERTMALVDQGLRAILDLGDE